EVRAPLRRRGRRIALRRSGGGARVGRLRPAGAAARRLGPRGGEPLPLPVRAGRLGRRVAPGAAAAVDALPGGGDRGGGERRRGAALRTGQCHIGRGHDGHGPPQPGRGRNRGAAGRGAVAGL
ncbi:MAG: hypothetical protein AVDCRST_MAG19-1111, partial [uncultured Thermomicrobiales bacterium]